MINTANLKASLKDLEEIRDTAAAAIGPLRELLSKLTNAGGVPAVSAPPIVASPNQPLPPVTEIAVSPAKPKPYTDAIPYSDELVSWIETQTGEFTIADFHDYLAGKFGAAMVNDQSIRNPFRRLGKEGKISTVREASGRRPAVFRTSKHLRAELERTAAELLK